MPHLLNFSYNGVLLNVVKDVAFYKRAGVNPREWPVHFENDIPIQVKDCRPEWAVCAKQLSLQGSQKPSLFFCQAGKGRKKTPTTEPQLDTCPIQYVNAAHAARWGIPYYPTGFPNRSSRA